MLHRSTPADLEVRSDGRTVVGIAVPFDEMTVVVENGERFVELFRHGAFARTITERGPSKVKFLAQHNKQALPLGRADVLREDNSGLYVELRASETGQADEVLTLIRDGALDGLSIGFTPVNDRWTSDRSLVERVEAKLHEISAVTFPAYAGAAITALRDGNSGLSINEAKRRLLQHQGRHPHV